LVKAHPSATSTIPPFKGKAQIQDMGCGQYRMTFTTANTQASKNEDKLVLDHGDNTQMNGHA
jgi:hypothetical protein